MWNTNNPIYFNRLKRVNDENFGKHDIFQDMLKPMWTDWQQTGIICPRGPQKGNMDTE